MQRENLKCNATNCASSQRTNPSNIRCEAYKCTYNRYKNCTADNVIIDAYKTSCDTFVCD